MTQRRCGRLRNWTTELVTVLFGCMAIAGAAEAAEPSKAALIRDALSAAPPSIAKTATVMDWDHTVLRQGGGHYICHPTPSAIRAKGGLLPMCMDEAWLKWADAWINKKPFKADRVGISYMLAGERMPGGASNIDPYATGPTADNQWVVEGPHIMVIVPDPAQLEGLPTDINNGGTYVMWKGTPYAHIMVPVANRVAAQR